MPTFVVGDIHGYPAVLARLLRDAGLVDRKSRWSGRDARLWLVGDLVDRGPDGIETIDLVRRLEREGDVRCLLGNHEAVMLAVSRFGDGRASGLDALFESYLVNGGQPSDLERFRPEHAAWIEQLPAVARDGDWLLLHSDTDLYLRFGRSMEEINRTISSILTTGEADVVEDLLGSLADRMMLSDPGAVDYLLSALGGTKIVHGHTPIAFVTETDPKRVVAPLEYGGGRVLNVDHCLFAGGQGFITELPVVSRDELGTKPSDVAP